MEIYSSFHGNDWTPQRADFHQNLEQFADRIGLIVGLQANGKIGQEKAFEQIKNLWKTLKISRKDLLPDNNIPVNKFIMANFLTYFLYFYVVDIVQSNK